MGKAKLQLNFGALVAGDTIKQLTASSSTMWALLGITSFQKCLKTEIRDSESLLPPQLKVRSEKNDESFRYHGQEEQGWAR